MLGRPQARTAAPLPQELPLPELYGMDPVGAQRDAVVWAVLLRLLWEDCCLRLPTCVCRKNRAKVSGDCHCLNGAAEK